MNTQPQLDKVDPPDNKRVDVDVPPRKPLEVSEQIGCNPLFIFIVLGALLAIKICTILFNTWGQK